MDASWRSPYLHNTRLGSWNYQEHAHARVCSALTYSVIQYSGVMPGFTWGWRLCPIRGLCQGWNKPWLGPTIEHGTRDSITTNPTSPFLIDNITNYMYMNIHNIRPGGATLWFSADHFAKILHHESGKFLWWRGP